MFLPLLLMQTSILLTAGSDLLVFIKSVGPVKSGDNVTLNCSIVAGGLADNISWYTIADVNTKMKVSKSSVAWDSLVLHDVTLKDALTYRCQANKGQETDYDEYTLDVYVKPEVQLSPLRITTSFDDIGEDCTATGFPKPNITWYFNGEVLKQGAMSSSVLIRTEPLTRTSVVSVLDLKGIERDHEGNYTCKATNELGSSRQTMLLLMRREPKVIAGGIQIIRESRNVTLSCEGQNLLNQDSDVAFFWDFERKRIPKNSAHYQQSTNRIPQEQVVHMKLAILNTSTGDAGLYDCHVKNSVKQSSGKVRLVVVSKDIKPKARIIGTNRTAVKLGSNVTLRCEISYPAYLETVNMSWSNSSAKYNVTEKNVDDDLTSRSFVLSLDFVNITRQDLGSYTCQINTSIGSSVARLQVILLQEGLDALRQDTSDDNLVMLALIITAGIAFGLSGALWVLRLWHKRKTPSYHGPINNEEFKYDVFITFSGKDFAWVKAKLIPLLEKHSVEYCIHNRDFELGKTILDNMADSVYKSKKVLAVMSRNYMDSKYCRGELEMALYRSTEMGDSSVIVIRIDNIEKDKLPKALRNRTFLDYYDETERKTWAERIMKHLTKTSIKI